MKKKIVWQADAFEMVASAGGKPERIPTAMVFDPYEPYILVSRVYPEGFSEANCLRMALEEALFTYAARPTEVHVRWGKEKAVEALTTRTGLRLVLCDELRELAEVKADFGNYARTALKRLGVTAGS